MKQFADLKLSFCITCKNRMHQIKKTLPTNLEENFVEKDKIEFVLVDFGSTDGLKDWIVNNFKHELESGYLKYYYTDELPYWHACIAKNTAHYYAKNDIVVNLDCDNYTGNRGGKYVIDQFIADNRVLLHQFNEFGDGTYGRIAVFKKYFDKIGGYDESFEPMAFHDTDLLIRMELLGLKYIRINVKEYCRAENNTKEEGLMYTDTEISWEEMKVINRNKHQFNLDCGNIIANNGKYGIRTAAIYK